MVEPPTGPHGAAKRKQFHEALLRQLYPSSPPSPPPHQETEAEPSFEHSVHCEEEDSDGSDPPSTKSDDEGIAGPKLTRSQRKRIKKRKLKEWVALCAKTRFIGPRLPSDSVNLLSDQISSSLPDQQATDVPHDVETIHPELQSPPKKVKKRRIAKRRISNMSSDSS